MILRLLAKSDLPIRVKWMNNPRIYKTMHFTPPISLEKTIEWHSNNVNNASRRDVAFEDDNGELIAMAGLTNIDYSVRKAEFYIFVNPDRQREGIGSEATYLLCKYGFEVLQLLKFIFTPIHPIVELVRLMKNEMIAEEKYEDRLYYGLLASELDTEKRQLTFGGAKDIIIEKQKICGRDICIVRDDLFPATGGGYKIP